MASGTPSPDWRLGSAPNHSSEGEFQSLKLLVPRDGYLLALKSGIFVRQAASSCSAAAISSAKQTKSCGPSVALPPDPHTPGTIRAGSWNSALANVPVPIPPGGRNPIFQTPSPANPTQTNHPHAPPAAGTRSRCCSTETSPSRPDSLRVESESSNRSPRKSPVPPISCAAASPWTPPSLSPLVQLHHLARHPFRRLQRRNRKIQLVHATVRNSTSSHRKNAACS